MHLSLNPACDSAISVVAMTGATITIDDAAATDTILSVKERLHAANRELPVRRQRLVYRPGPRGMEALADDETLGGAGVARDGTAELDVLVEPLTDAEMAALGQEVWWLFKRQSEQTSFLYSMHTKRFSLPKTAYSTSLITTTF